jgi:F-type H+-transporting ATPase subunit alpha
MVELLKQPQYDPFPVEEQIVSIYAGAKGFMDDLPVNKVREFETRLLQYLRDQKPEILQELKDTGVMSDTLAEAIGQAATTVKSKMG